MSGFRPIDFRPLPWFRPPQGDLKLLWLTEGQMARSRPFFPKSHDPDAASRIEGGDPVAKQPGRFWLCRTHHTRLHSYGQERFPIAAPAEGSDATTPD